MQFEFYVLNYNINKKTTEMFNIFQNGRVQQECENEIRKYLRGPRHYRYLSYNHNEATKYIYGFDGLCEKIDRIIMCEELGRSEYEISAGDKFETDCKNLKTWDCYQQAHANIRTIVRDCINQYKEQKMIK